MQRKPEPSWIPMSGKVHLICTRALIAQGDNM